MTKNKLIQTSSLFLLVIIFSHFLPYSDGKQEVRVIEPVYAADFSDDKVLVGGSHNVFVGKVIKQVGEKDRGVGPETQFEVQVVANIKGEISGTVIVNQAGGYRDGVLYLVSSDHTQRGEKNNETSSLLKPGNTYVFATRYSLEENWYTLNSYPTALKLISNAVQDERMLETMSLNSERVKQLKEAYKNEILLEADIKANNTRNSYKSLKTSE